jgi:ACDE family multidrug resistance protein
VFGAPRLQSRFGTARTLYGNFVLLGLDLAVIGVGHNSPTTVIIAVIVAGAFLGINNTLVTQAVMMVSPVERPVASASYSFVRFIGGGLAPWVAGKIAEHTNEAIPFYLGAITMALALVIFATGHKIINEADAKMAAEGAHHDRSSAEVAEDREREGAEGLESLAGSDTVDTDLTTPAPHSSGRQLRAR